MATMMMVMFRRLILALVVCLMIQIKANEITEYRTQTILRSSSFGDSVKEPSKRVLRSLKTSKSSKDALVSTVGADVILNVALKQGFEFEDPNSYQSKALVYVEEYLPESGMSEEDYISYYVLACIYYATNGVANKKTDAVLSNYNFPLPNWLCSHKPGGCVGWISSMDKCRWQGITCDDEERIIGIDLGLNLLIGEFPAEVSLLSDSLQVLDLYNNVLLVNEGDEGNWWLAMLTNLVELRLGLTAFAYEGVPPYLGSLTKLEQLDISLSFYQNGPIPHGIFDKLSNLRYLDMASNVYTTTLPSSISRLPNLQYLYLDYASFTGKAQSLDFMVGMPSIIECWVDGANLVGSIPTEIGDLSTLVSWSVERTGLSGTIPTELGKLSSMRKMWLGGNSLTGTISETLGSLTEIEIVQFHGNRLDGAIPVSMCLNISPATQEFTADCTVTDINFVECPCCTCCGNSC